MARHAAARRWLVQLHTQPQSQLLLILLQLRLLKLLLCTTDLRPGSHDLGWRPRRPAAEAALVLQIRSGCPRLPQD